MSLTERPSLGPGWTAWLRTGPRASRHPVCLPVAWNCLFPPRLNLGAPWSRLWRSQPFSRCPQYREWILDAARSEEGSQTFCCQAQTGPLRAPGQYTGSPLASAGGLGPPGFQVATAAFINGIFLFVSYWS